MPRNDVAEFSPATVRKIWERCLAACERCGRGLDRSRRGYQWSIHHRQPRGMGGSSDPALGEASNGLAVCGHGTAGCHGRIEANRPEAIAAGYIVPNGELPADVPVVLYAFGRVRLLDDGNVANP